MKKLIKSLLLSVFLVSCLPDLLSDSAKENCEKERVAFASTITWLASEQQLTDDEWLVLLLVAMLPCYEM